MINNIWNIHYSKSQIFVQKFNFDKKPNIFTSFSPKQSTIFSGNQSSIFGQHMKISNGVNQISDWNTTT